jgi:hypothetical protein
VAALKAKGVTSFASAGWCWGASMAVQAAAADPGSFKATAFLHPSMFGHEKELVAKLQCPLASFSTPGGEFSSSQQQHEVSLLGCMRWPAQRSSRSSPSPFEQLGVHGLPTHSCLHITAYIRVSWTCASFRAAVPVVRLCAADPLEAMQEVMDGTQWGPECVYRRVANMIHGEAPAGLFDCM